MTLHVGEWSNAVDTRRADQDRPRDQSVLLRTVVLVGYIIASALLIYYWLSPLRSIGL